jgi:hypothetical protein
MSDLLLALLRGPALALLAALYSSCRASAWPPRRGRAPQA